MAQRYGAPDRCELEVAACIATRNWMDLRDYYEAPAKQLLELLLKKPDRFQDFIKRYRLLRGKPRRTERDCEIG